MYNVYINLLIAVLCLSGSSSVVLGHESTPNNPQQDKCVRDVPQDCTEIRDCAESLQANRPASGIYTIQPSTYPQPFYVYCDMDTDGGGWTVFQKRTDGTVDFYRTWDDYKQGFGNVINSEYWLGNEKLFYLTAQGNYELRVDMSDFDERMRYAHYDFFSIGDESNLYKLSIGSYKGTAGDSLKRQRGMYFSTKDEDNDIDVAGNCAITFKGAWWYAWCHDSNLNGLYLGGPHESFADGVNWYTWHDYYYSLKTTQMKIRHLFK